MDPFDDYQDEVERLSDAEIDALLSGEGHLARPVATLIRDVRLDLLESPSPDIAARHIAAMAAVRPHEPDRPAALVTRLRRRHLLPRKRLTAVALAAVLLFLAGLATAVTLPIKPDRAKPDTLPTMAPSLAPTEKNLAEEPTHGQAVAEVAKDPSFTGCEKGQAVAAIASAKATEHRNNPDRANDPCVRAKTKGKAKSKSGGPGDNPAAAGGVAEGRTNSHPVGSGTATAPGLSRRPSQTGPEAAGSATKGGAAGGGIGAGGPGGNGGSGGAPTDHSRP